jgi:two-component system sensor histidine kinase MtrB
MRAVPEGALLTVTDDGEGVPPEQAERIFDPCFRAHEHRGQVPSLGLGLHIGGTLARMMGGDLIYRRNGGSTRFMLLLPSDLPPNDGVDPDPSRT